MRRDVLNLPVLLSRRPRSRANTLPDDSGEACGSITRRFQSQKGAIMPKVAGAARTSMLWPAVRELAQRAGRTTSDGLRGHEPTTISGVISSQFRVHLLHTCDVLTHEAAVPAGYAHKAWHADSSGTTLWPGPGCCGTAMSLRVSTRQAACTVGKGCCWHRCDDAE